jgi:vancomycin resistance protein YoaR
MSKFIAIVAFILCSLTSVAAAQQQMVISEYTTEYAHRGLDFRDRAANIERAAELLDGKVILIGETFSYNAAVGPRAEKRGFKMAHVIISGDLVDGLGGGVCQLSSTLHAAALLAGFPMVEEHPHSRASAYIDPTLDATVAWGSLDFKFTNSFSFPVTIHTVITKEARGKAKLTVQLWGRGDPYDVTIEFLTRKKKPFKTQYVRNDDAPAGYRKKLEPGSFGYDIERVRTIRSRTGVAASRDVAKYHYEPSDRIWVLGPKKD